MTSPSAESPLGTGTAPLADPAFRNLWLSNSLFFSGFWAQAVVLAWMAFDLTGSEFAVAAFTAAALAPMLTGPLGGIVADRLDRPRFCAPQSRSHSRSAWRWRPGIVRRNRLLPEHTADEERAAINGETASRMGHENLRLSQ